MGLLLPTTVELNNQEWRVMNISYEITDMVKPQQGSGSVGFQVWSVCLLEISTGELFIYNVDTNYELLPNT